MSDINAEHVKTNFETLFAAKAKAESDIGALKQQVSRLEGLLAQAKMDAEAMSQRVNLLLAKSMGTGPLS